MRIPLLGSTEIEPTTSDYLIQVVHQRTGQVVRQWAPGFEVERDFKTELLSRTRAKGVGIGRTQNHVLTDLASAFDELLLDLKNQVR